MFIKSVTCLPSGERAEEENGEGTEFQRHGSHEALLQVSHCTVKHKKQTDLCSDRGGVSL